MGAGHLGPIIGAFAAMWLCCVEASAAVVEDMCAPSEATDPQALHINGSTPYVYKTIGDIELRLHVFRSAARGPDARSPAVVFYYGGGFLFGDIRRFQTQATHLALQGVVTVLVDYRVRCRHGSTIMDSITDGKSAMRWVRERADELGIDPSRIAAVGSSAGGVIAAAAALVTEFDDPNDAEVDPRPNALILYNPGLAMASPTAMENMTARWGSAVAERAPDFSPIDHLDRGLPPTIIFQGEEDPYTPPATAEEFCSRARALNAQCDVVLYPGATHGFTEVWLGLEDPAAFPNTAFWASDTSRRTDDFLTALGWLPPR